MKNTKPCKHDTKEKDCRICFLYETDAKYRNLWTPTPTHPEHMVIISLERRPDRRMQALSEFHNQGIFDIEIFNAIDGKLLKIPEGHKAGHGALGCLESHKAVLMRALTREVRCLAVFEDDVTLVENFYDRMTELCHHVTQIDPKWDGIFLGGQHRKTPYPVDREVQRCADCHRTHGYILRGDYIARMLEIWSTNWGHADHIWGRYQHEARLYTPIEWLCGQRQTKSDISGREDGERWWQRGGKRNVAPRPARQIRTPQRNQKRLIRGPEQKKDCGCKKGNK